jgi:hypothetical protein
VIDHLSPEDFARPCTPRQRAEFIVGATPPPPDSAPDYFDEVLARHDDARATNARTLFGRDGHG